LVPALPGLARQEISGGRWVLGKRLAVFRTGLVANHRHYSGLYSVNVKVGFIKPGMETGTYSALIYRLFLYIRALSILANLYG